MDTEICRACGGRGQKEYVVESHESYTEIESRNCSHCDGHGHAPFGGWPKPKPKRSDGIRAAIEAIKHFKKSRSQGTV